MPCCYFVRFAGVGEGGCCNEPNFFNSHTALVQLNGALVGGPDNADTFPDRRPDYQRSEVVGNAVGFVRNSSGWLLTNAQLSLL
jgi:hypothetical protein